MYLVSYYNLSFPLSVPSALSYGSMISSTDTVATLAVFAHAGAPANLNAIVGGESLLNDAVSIVLYSYVLLFALTLRPELTARA